jgi:hypothetical protein
MRAGYNGRVAISWNQTELDGLEAAPLAFLAVGSAWSWRGQALVLGEVAEQNLEQLGHMGATAVRTRDAFSAPQEISGEYCGSVTLTNGAQRFSADLVITDDEQWPTLVFNTGCPPRDQDFWISEVTHAGAELQSVPQPTAKVVAFPGKSAPGYFS